jgi:DNA-binding NarL/FixJ family response regulator
VGTLRANREKRLTPRQREVLQLLTEGCTMREAAAALHVSTRTIAFHNYKMMKTFGLKTNSDLFRFAVNELVIIVF